MTDKETEVTDLINRTYYDPSQGVVGLEKLYHKLKDYGVSRKEIRDFLKQQEVVQINERPDFQGSFVPMYPLHEFQIDLIYLENPHLNQAAYGLCCIDVFSKKADIELMKRKDQDETVRAMEVLLNKMGTPEIMYCDEGTEFTSKAFRTLMKDYGIELVLTVRHAPVVERFNRTIKHMISKYLQVTKSKTITKVLPLLIKNYNNSYHKTIKMAPNEVTNSNVIEVWHNIYNQSKKKVREAIKAGDKVRVLIKEKAFTKKYKPRWSKEVHTVTQRRGTYYYVSGSDKKYLRAYLKKIDGVQAPEIEPILEDTLEGRLKEMGKRPLIPRTEEEPLEKEISRPARNRQLPKKLSIFNLE